MDYIPDKIKNKLEIFIKAHALKLSEGKAFKTTSERTEDEFFHTTTTKTKKDVTFTLTQTFFPHPGIHIYILEDEKGEKYTFHSFEWVQTQRKYYFFQAKDLMSTIFVKKLENGFNLKEIKQSSDWMTFTGMEIPEKSIVAILRFDYNINTDEGSFTIEGTKDELLDKLGNYLKMKE